MDTLYIIIPAYNESANIEQVIRDWYPVVCRHPGRPDAAEEAADGVTAPETDDVTASETDGVTAPGTDGQTKAYGSSRLVIVNDGSRDDTLAIAKKCCAGRPQLIVLDKANGGHGSAVLHGCRYAIRKKADYIFQTDSDGQTDPAEFEAFWNAREDSDAVIGDRHGRQDGKSRVFVENVLRFLLFCIFGVRVPDANAPYRLMKRSALERYLPKMPKNYALPNVMLTTYLAYYRDPVKFIRISFRPRQGGTNSINIRKIIKIGMRSMREFAVLRKHM